MFKGVIELAEKSMPYAAVGNVMDVLNRYRNRNLPEVVDNTAMRTAGVPEGMVGRTLGALRFLGLLNEASEPTPEWKALSDVDDEAFPQYLGGLVKAAYSEIFALVSPETDGQERIRRAFQPYQPKSQIARMVTLFLGLCAESNIPTLDAPKRRVTKAQQGEDTKGRVRMAAPPKRQSIPPPPPIKPLTPVTGESKTITLRGGGTLTLHASASFFGLPREDRDFVFELLDKLSEYEGRRLLTAGTNA